MAEFDNLKIGSFLGTVRKYMQIRGSMSQKDLAILTETGISTMSRFLGQKTTELNPQLIAKIVAKLEIPLYEIIDFVDEDYSDKFIRLVKFYKDDVVEAESEADVNSEVDSLNFGRRKEDQVMPGAGSAKKDVTATVSIGGSKVNIPFSTEAMANDEKAFFEKFNALSPRQKAYVADFLNLDVDGRDLMVDLGASLFRYFRQKGMNF